ncbi:hypothetical protein QZM93_30940 [Burkholderia cepacia]|uniref:hypothetical protein n=1 Tax=Burkholderia cepacia TaxID=292 RepID=UPI0011AC9E4D|nr:hypothetical protein [Burkholderia cepacia]MDN7893026.1 hypothetical protein [Burkholderia cepacia]
MMGDDNKKIFLARKKLQLELEKSLNTGKYKELFLEDIFRLWQCDEISPEVILRELRVLEGIEKPLMEFDGDEPIPIWFGSSNSTKPDTYLSRSLSATKRPTQFTGQMSPLSGLWHKHYFVYQDDFLKQNIENEGRKHKTANLHPLTAMTVRIAEGGVTGEWIIFEKTSDKNTYLALAKHNDGDQAIFDRLKAAGAMNPSQK